MRCFLPKISSARQALLKSRGPIPQQMAAIHGAAVYLREGHITRDLAEARTGSHGHNLAAEGPESTT